MSSECSCSNWHIFSYGILYLSTFKSWFKVILTSNITEVVVIESNYFQIFWSLKSYSWT